MGLVLKKCEALLGRLAIVNNGGTCHINFCAINWETCLHSSAKTRHWTNVEVRGGNIKNVKHTMGSNSVWLFLNDNMYEVYGP